MSCACLEAAVHYLESKIKVTFAAEETSNVLKHYLECRLHLTQQTHLPRMDVSPDHDARQAVIQR